MSISNAKNACDREGEKDDAGGLKAPRAKSWPSPQGPFSDYLVLQDSPPPYGTGFHSGRGDLHLITCLMTTVSLYVETSEGNLRSTGCALSLLATQPHLLPLKLPISSFS